jgi:Asp-tRNA(Asn)/Glu-tRNA(Gln) amidotransferase A subunit family amidase/Asp-tRNA(Asn)/Glu-tRNA(Gln) amidotransferase C subunit
MVGDDLPGKPTNRWRAATMTTTETWGEGDWDATEYGLEQGDEPDQAGQPLAGEDRSAALRRRAVLKGLTAMGIGTLTFRRAMAAQAAQSSSPVSREMVRQAEWIAGITFDDKERDDIARSLGQSLRSFDQLRKVDVGYDVPPALTFFPTPPRPAAEVVRNRAKPTDTRTPDRPGTDEELAFLPVTELSRLVRSRKVSSVELTRLYLERLKRFNPLLNCVVTLTPELAMKQAEQADREIAAGRYRGPLHGIPWGAKDLIAYPGYPTTWGATPFKDRIIDVKATVAARLEEAGAVLVAKLSLGALAMGDHWFRGQTKSPWNPRTGSSGSSAGSASASAAGLVGFAIGSETLGSIVSPCRACGASGLRPTFGRVSRHGCMTLSWSMDKIGPIARSVEDCALIFDAIHGADGLDAAAVDQPFAWPVPVDFARLKVGFVEDPRQPTERRADLHLLRQLGFELVPMTFPTELPVRAITLMLGTEAAAAFDEITRCHVTEGLNEWPSTFRQGQFVPAVEYIRAARVRTKLMQAMAERMAKVDLYVGSGLDLPITNLTGHPTVVFPVGYLDRQGRPVPGSITLTGRLFDESTILAVAHAAQQAARDNLAAPPVGRFLAEDPPARNQATPAAGD